MSERAAVRTVVSPVRDRPTTVYTFPISIRPGGGLHSLFIEGPFPLTPQEWANFTTVLEAFRPGLVDEPPTGRGYCGHPVAGDE
jgi:hypothetical protein